MNAVERALGIIEQDVPVHGCFCFLTPDGGPGRRRPAAAPHPTIDGFPLYRPRRLSKRLDRDGPIGTGQIAVLAEALVELFPAA